MRAPMDETFFVVLDTKGAGRVVGVFDTDVQAAEVAAVSPQYYRVTKIRKNDINPESVRWVADAAGRETLQRLSAAITAIPDDNPTREEKAYREPMLGGNALAVGVGIVATLWQVVIIALAFRYAPQVEMLVGGLSVSPPPTTGIFVLTYPFWPVVPLLSAVLIWLSRKRPTASIMAAINAFAFGLILQALTIEAVLAPVRAVISKLG